MESRDRTGNLDYRAFMTCRAPDGWLSQAQAQFAAWLREKRWDVDVAADGRHDEGSRQLLIRNHSDRHSRAYHARLVEAGTPQGSWTTNLYAQHRHGGGDWLSITVENDKGSFVDVPRLAKYLMQALPLGDGPIDFLDEPVVFHEDRVEAFTELLCDPQRRGLVFAAGTTTGDEIAFDVFAARVKEWARQVYGLAQVVVLDPAATAALAARIGDRHHVPPWTIRTYQPEVDPASVVDARRHRILGTASLGGLSDGRIHTLLGTVARAHAAERPTPDELVRTRRVFERIENQEIVRAIEPPSGGPATEPVATPVARIDESPPEEALAAPTASDAGTAVQPARVPDEGVVATPTISVEVERYLAQLELVKALLGVTSLDEAVLSDLAVRAAAPRADPVAVARAAEAIRTQQARIEELEDDLRAAQDGLSDESLERAILQVDLDGARAEVAYLRARLRDAGDYEGSFSPAPAAEIDTPASFADLIERLPALADQGVVFTGNKDVVRSLDDHAALVDVAVRAAWDTLSALADYVRARRGGAWDKGVHMYLRETPSGGYRAVPDARHASTESDTTMSAYGDQRVFPVPARARPRAARSTTAAEHGPRDRGP